MRTWFCRITLPALAVLLLAGCSDAGQLHDAGPARAVAVHPSPEPLWAAAVTTQTPTPAVTSGQPAPSPVPGITVPGDDIRSVSARTVLEKDAAELRPDERVALNGCEGCLVQPERYRDLVGDGRDELITAVLTGSERAVLHVYELRDHRILPVLAVPVLPGFTADTVGQNLVVHEPNGRDSQTDTTYQWQGGLLAVVDRRIKGTDPAAANPSCAPTMAVPTALSPDGPMPSAVPSRPAAVSGAGAGPGATTSVTVRPTP